MKPEGIERLKGYFLKRKNTEMFNKKLQRLMDEFGIKQEALVSCIGCTRVTFGKKMRDNSFSEYDKALIMKKYGSLL